LKGFLLSLQQVSQFFYIHTLMPIELLLPKQGMTLQIAK